MSLQYHTQSCVGAGESGKSTLAKQMKIIHQEGFNQQELVAYTLPVFANCLTALKVVIGITLHKEEMSKKAKVSFTNAHNDVKESGRRN